MSGQKKNKSALSVSEGVPRPDPINKEAVSRLKKAKKKHHTTVELLEGIQNREISMLSRAITLVESSLPQHQSGAQELIAACLPLSGNAFRLGITGVPGAGKSTFIEALGKQIIDEGGRLAVLAIDPSSERSKGSILGDKTRMEELAGRHEAYIRPSPSSGTLGGVARKTRETIILCEAAGFDNIFVETVGVGQSETAVHSMVDFFLLIMLAGAGDELQGIKRGIMEMADAIVINKADGNNIQKARRAQAEFANALHLFPPALSGWTPQVKTCSSLYNTGINETWEMVGDYREHVSKSGYLKNRRQEQSRYWMYETIREGIYNQVFNDPAMQHELAKYEKAISEGRMTSFMAAASILNKYKSPDKTS
ncbi:MAG: methylmalonyl Co-A mutase-associated GTPase MeaB [Bacteroidales bacterium]|nr:methylmalonyl Co-A mutase-associated GTPase MeaB [Bacteroidales bacterium]